MLDVAVELALVGLEREVEPDVAVERRAAGEPQRGVGGAAAHGGAEGQRAGLRAHDLEVRRLGDQAGVEGGVALERGERAEPAVLLGGDREQHDLGVDAARLQLGQRVQRRDDAALHVDRPAAVDVAVLDHARPRPVPPRLAALGDHVDVAA